MPKLNRNALSARMVRHAGPGSYVDGNGLMLRVRARGTRSWVQRLMVHGRRVDIGLGSADLVSLADARRIAADNRAVARTGGDPRRARTITFAEAEPRALAEKAETWRDGSPSLRDWRATMAAYVLPQLGKMHVGAVATADVKRVLRPLALAGKHATARMVAGRIAAVLEWAEVENLREPAGSGRAAVETVMRSLPKAAAVRHHRALHFSDVAAALAKVDGHPRIGRVVQLAIRFGGADGGAAGGGAARGVGRVRPRGGGMDGPRSAHEARPRAPGAAVHGSAGGAGRSAGDVPRRRARVPRPRRRRGSASRRCRKGWRGRRWARRRTASGRASRTGRATRAWTSCSQSSRWRMSRGRRRWPPTRATISSRNAARSCRRGPTSCVRRATDLA